MDKQLQAIKDAWDKDSGDGRDDTKTRQLADKYVQANPDKFEKFQDLDVHQCVQRVDAARAYGDDDEVQLLETWLLHRFEPQDIGGPATARVRLPGRT